MEMKDLRSWLFELIAVLVPGSYVVWMVATFGHDPSHFATQSPSPQPFESFIFPFVSDVLNVVYALGLSFVAGQLIQQASGTLIRLYCLVFRVKRSGLVGRAFGSTEVREFILPPHSQLSAESLELGSADYFRMIYPDHAPRTKRDTFIAVADFCGGMVAANVLLVALGAISLVAYELGGLAAPPVSAIRDGSLVLATTLLLAQRSVSYQDLADAVVVDYFLGKIGERAREASPGEATRSRPGR